MELNCEMSNTSAYSFDKFYCVKDNYENKACSSEMITEKTCSVLGIEENKAFNLLSTIMKENLHHLEVFKSRHFPHSYNCRAENAIKIFFGWSVGVNIKEICQYLDISEDIARHFYLLSTLYAKKYITSHIDEWKLGGFGIVVLLDVYPQGCNKLNYSANNHQDPILCLAEIKDIPTKYWFQILNQSGLDRKDEEILESLCAIVRIGSIIVVDLESTAITETTLHRMKILYKVVVSLESLKQHDTENQCLLDNLETIWKPALDICEFANYHNDISSYYTSFLWNQRFGNDNLSTLLNQF